LKKIKDFINNPNPNIIENVTTLITKDGIYVAIKVTPLGYGKFEVEWKKK